MHPMVSGACELLGIDPLYVANEGKFIAVVAQEEAEAGLAALRSHPLGAEAAEVGQIVAEPAETVVVANWFRWFPDRRHAGRRPAAEDLLRVATRKELSANVSGNPGADRRDHRR